NWQKHFDLSFDPDTARAYHDEDLDVDTDFCAMCGHDWCSVRISKEIIEFLSGKDEDYQWDQAKVTNALTPEQKEILEKRGVLSPDEIHRLASKTKSAMSDTDDSDASLDANKPTCHSDHLDANEAKELQQDQLVQLDVRPAVGLSKEDSVI
ncbi:MAG: phosphomethylpyrimidine synthase ThiC, partial [Phycisphaeraceae bacterium]|nr:phosphomethylpyrimidine synthase ThiC [Phycisphaeraceae bacterium]